MYIKLSFLEEKINVPQSWSGRQVSLHQFPQIIDKLPHDKKANHFIDISDNLRTFSGKQPNDIKCFEYFIDCRHMCFADVKKAVTKFNEKVGNELPGFPVEDENEIQGKNNPILKQIKNIIAEVHHPHLAKLFKLFKRNNKSKYEQTLESAEELRNKLIM